MGNRFGATSPTKTPPSAPPRGHHEVEERQSVFRRGLAARQFAVAEHAANEQRRGEYRDLPSQSAGRAFQGNAGADGDPGGGHQPAKQRRAVPAIGFEAQDEAKQIDRHRNHPEKRHGGHLLSQIIRDGQPQRGGAGGERDPEPWADVRQRWAAGCPADVVSGADCRAAATASRNSSAT